MGSQVKRTRCVRRSVLDDRLDVACTSDLKRRAAEVAAAKDMPAAQFIRDAIMQAVERTQMIPGHGAE